MGSTFDALFSDNMELPEGSKLDYAQFEDIAQHAQKQAVQDANAFFTTHGLDLSDILDSMVALSLRDSNKDIPNIHAYYSLTNWAVLSKLMGDNAKARIPSQEDLSGMQENEIISLAQSDANTHKLHINLNESGTHRARMLAAILYAQALSNILQGLEDSDEISDEVKTDFLEHFEESIIHCRELKLYPNDSQAHFNHFSFVLYYTGTNAQEMRQHDLRILVGIAQKYELVSNIPAHFFTDSSYDTRDVSMVHRYSSIVDRPSDYPSNGSDDEKAEWKKKHFKFDRNYTSSAIFSTTSGNTEFKLALKQSNPRLFYKLYKPPRYHELKDEYMPKH